MSEVRVASRYAKSLIELAQEKGHLEDIHEELHLFKVTCDQSRELRLMLQNPIISSDKKLKTLKAIFGKHFSEITTRFVEIVSRKNRESLLYAISKEVHDQYNVIMGIKSATVTTVKPLNEELRASIQNMVQDISGTKVELQEKTDPSIAGGYILQIADKRIDASLKSKIQNLKRTFERE